MNAQPLPPGPRRLLRAGAAALALGALLACNEQPPSVPAAELQAVLATPAIIEGQRQLRVELEDASAIIERAASGSAPAAGGASPSTVTLEDDQSGLQVRLELAEQTAQPQVRARWRDDPGADWRTLDRAAPQRARDLLRSTWPKLREEMPAVEAQWRTTDSDFASHFAPRAMPEALGQLYAFQRRAAGQPYADGFELAPLDDSGRRTWSSDPAFVSAFVEFATANGSGSSYALWLVDEDLSQCPVVVFGDEGGLYVVADNLQQLLQLLTLDQEVRVLPDTGASFDSSGRDADRWSALHEAYVAFARKRGDITPLSRDEQANAIVRAARERWQPRLDAFLKKFDADNARPA